MVHSNILIKILQSSISIICYSVMWYYHVFTLELLEVYQRNGHCMLPEMLYYTEYLNLHSHRYMNLKNILVLYIISTSVLWKYLIQDPTLHQSIVII